MTDRQVIDLSRRKPSQSRARRTVETILEATARILATEGGEALTTNCLAERSGFSIGTIYQYFSNREAIVLALIERQRDMVRQRVDEALAHATDDPVETRIDRVLQVLHDAFTAHRTPERRLAQALIRAAIAQGLPTPPNVAVEAIIGLWSQANEDVHRPLDAAETFVLTRAVIEVLRQAVLHGSPLLGTAALQDALMRLVLGFLRDTSARIRETSSVSTGE